MKKRGPWKIKSSRLVYKNPWMSVREDAVIHPNGKPGIVGVHTKESGVTVIPFDGKGNIFLIREYRYALGRISIESANGAIDMGESKLHAAKRELKEETGLTAKKWKYLGIIDPFTMTIRGSMHMYLAMDLIRGSQRLEGTEQIKVIKVPFERAIQWVMQSKITFSATCLALLKAEKYLKTQKR